MKKRINLIITNPLFSGGAVMIIGSNAVNALNYLYHLVMGRMLGPAGYGEIVAIISLVGVLSTVPSFFNLVVIKFVSSAKNEEEISGLIEWLNKKVLYSSLIFAIFLAAGAPLVAEFLNIQNPTYMFLAAIIFGLTLTTLFYDSVIQGVLRFKEMIISSFVGNSVKLLIGFVLVLYGLSVSGAVVSMIIAGVLTILISRYFIRDYLGKKGNKVPDLKPLFFYSLPVMLRSITFVSLGSTDLLLVKHFFTPHDAGIYAALSTLGKIIIFGAGPIGAVMFPLVSRRQSRGENYKSVFFYSLGLTSLMVLAIILVYSLFPSTVINLLYGTSYIEAKNILFLFGLSAGLFILSSLLINYYLSIGHTRVIFIPLLASIFQAIGIWFYHGSIVSVISVTLATMSFLFATLIVYFCYMYKKTEK